VKLRFDFYIPDKNICIEYDGIQHYKPTYIFGSAEKKKKTQKRDQIKNLFCEIIGIKLIRIPYYIKDEEMYKILDNELLN